MAELKTRPTAASVKEFLDGIADERRRRECRAVAKLMREVTGEKPRMWGPSIVGYGSYTYRYESGRSGEWFLTGFSPRKTSLTLYIMAGFARHAALMKRLGRHTTGKSCLYLRRLEDVDLEVLRELVRESVAFVRSRHGAGSGCV